MKKIQLTLVGLLFLAIAFAETPLKTNFSVYYSSIEQVNLAEELGKLDGKIASYLLDESVLLENKAAVINALYINSNADFNAVSFKQYLARQLRADWQSLDLSKLSGDELFCLGYLSIMDNPNEPQTALDILEQSVEKSNSSFIVNLFHSMVQAQIFANEKNYCEAYKICEETHVNTSLIADFNDTAINIIFESISDYNKNCK